MRNSHFFLSLVAAILIFAACKKSDAPAAPKSVVGYWVGKYGGGSGTPTSFYGFLFRSDGTVRIYEDADTTVDHAEGAYIITGSLVSTQYYFGVPGGTPDYSTSAAINTDYTSMTGTWGNGTSSSGQGTFYLDKQ